MKTNPKHLDLVKKLAETQSFYHPTNIFGKTFLDVLVCDLLEGEYPYIAKLRIRDGFFTSNGEFYIQQGNWQSEEKLQISSEDLKPIFKELTQKAKEQYKLKITQWSKKESDNIDKAINKVLGQ